MSILYDLEAPVKTWKKGLKRLDTVIETKKQEDRDYHLQRIFYGLADKSADPYSRNLGFMEGQADPNKFSRNQKKPKSGANTA